MDEYLDLVLAETRCYEVNANVFAAWRKIFFLDRYGMHSRIIGISLWLGKS